MKKMHIMTGLAFALMYAGNIVHAAPTRLVCDMADVSIASDGPATVVFDEPKNTISINSPAEWFKSSPEIRIPQLNATSVTAKFTSEQINFQIKSGGNCWGLNRLTGELKVYVNEGCSGERWAWRYMNCRPAKAQF